MHTAVGESLRAAGYAHAADGVWERPGSPELTYSDGDATEESLAAALRGARDVSWRSAELSAHMVDWPTRYHLSRARANILRSIEGVLGDSILEIGAGCGAITRWLGESKKVVVALEGSRRRAAICRERCRDLENVFVVCDRHETFPVDLQFDVVTLIGVLEYASAFSALTVDAERHLLCRCRSWCVSDGVVVVAIENRFGLKYWAGAPEDHLSVPNVGLHGAYREDGPKTFTQVELAALLEAAGLVAHATALPFPDYKLASTVVMPKGANTDSEVIANLVRFSDAADPQPYVSRFSTEQVWPSVVRERLLSTFSNSFLVVAGAANTHRVATLNDSAIAAIHYGSPRKKSFEKETRFVFAKDGITVERRGFQSQDRAQGLRAAYEAAEPAFSGTVWTAALAAIVARSQWRFDEIATWAAFWFNALRVQLADKGVSSLQASTQIPRQFFDAGPQNLLVANDKTWRFIDLEWLPAAEPTLGFVVFRSLFFALRTIKYSEPTRHAEHSTLRAAIGSLFDSLGLVCSGEDLRNWIALERDFQADASGEPRAADHMQLGGSWAHVGHADGAAPSSGGALATLDARVYFSGEVADFSEADSRSSVIALSGEFKTIRVDVASSKPIRTLRVDPVSSPGFFVLRKLAFADLEGRPLEVTRSTSAGLTAGSMESGDQWVFSKGEDPYWLLEFAEGHDAIAVEIEVARANAQIVDMALSVAEDKRAQLVSADAMLAALVQSELLPAATTSTPARFATATAAVMSRADEMRSALERAEAATAHAKTESAALRQRLDEIENHRLMKLARGSQRLSRRLVSRLKHIIDDTTFGHEPKR